MWQQSGLDRRREHEPYGGLLIRHLPQPAAGLGVGLIGSPGTPTMMKKWTWIPALLRLSGTRP
ncbi:hypothetical protein C5746_25880 [Streptomyces atratus]|uniref:Uncharacterized protein n=1 Tax=Streptomyces atratus TaxID=1893 RepID=A0A2Z5JHM7_STRAR|nr:hypothetical protein C5746_25880 [Streptomyces atratus]